MTYFDKLRFIPVLFIIGVSIMSGSTFVMIWIGLFAALIIATEIKGV